VARRCSSFRDFKDFEDFRDFEDPVKYPIEYVTVPPMPLEVLVALRYPKVSRKALSRLLPGTRPNCTLPRVVSVNAAVTWIHTDTDNSCPNLAQYFSEYVSCF
jgi:hypothetical protein